MSKYLMIWPKSQDVMHINYHYTQFGEVIDYLNTFLGGQVIAVDQDVDNRDIFDVIRENKVEKIAMQVNYENVANAFELCERIKQEYGIPVFGYGNIPVMLPKLFLNSKFDAIYNSGDAEVAIKSFFKNYNVN